MNTPQLKSILGAGEPVYAPATRAYNDAIAFRLVLGSIREGLVKQGDVEGKPQTAPYLHETIQSVLARPRANTSAVAEQMYNTGDFQGIPGV
jgi:hypothetical protein